MDVVDTQLYDLLNVSPNASPSEIKKAYHTLVRREHPDKVPESERPAAAEKFKAIQEAYDTLRDPDTRAQYDEMGLDGMHDGHNGGPHGGGMDMDDLFAQMFGGPPGSSMGGGGMPNMSGMGGGPGNRRSKPRKQNVEHTYPVSLEDLYRGKSTKMKGTRNKICPTCAGSGCKQNHKPSKCASCDGRGSKTANMMVGPGLYSQQQVECPSCLGTGQSIREKDRCKKCKGKKVVDEVKLMEVFIDKGMRDGETIVLHGQADQVPGGETGDVIITLEQKQHDIFTRLGADLKTDLNITLAESLCGFSRTVSTHLDGRKLKYTSQLGKVLRPGDTIVVKGEGMPLGKRREGFGDLYLSVHVQFPDDNFLSEKGEYSRLASLLPQKPINASPATSDATALGDAIEEDIEGIPGDMDDFGGDARNEDPDWTDDEGEDGDDGPGVQCAQQ